MGENLTEYINDHPEANRLGLVCTPPPSDGQRAHRFQAIWDRQWPRIPPLQRRGSRGPKGGALSSMSWYYN